MNYNQCNLNKLTISYESDNLLYDHNDQFKCVFISLFLCEKLPPPKHNIVARLYRVSCRLATNKRVSWRVFDTLANLRTCLEPVRGGVTRSVHANFDGSLNARGYTRCSASDITGGEWGRGASNASQAMRVGYKLYNILSL